MLRTCLQVKISDNIQRVLNVINLPNYPMTALQFNALHVFAEQLCSEHAKIVKSIKPEVLCYFIYDPEYIMYLTTNLEFHDGEINDKMDFITEKDRDKLTKYKNGEDIEDDLDEERIKSKNNTVVEDADKLLEEHAMFMTEHEKYMEEHRKRSEEHIKYMKERKTFLEQQEKRQKELEKEMEKLATRTSVIEECVKASQNLNK